MPLETEPLGRKAVAYWNTGNLLLTDTSGATIQSWLNDPNTRIVGDIFDVTQNTTPEYADITTRGAAQGGFTARKPVIREGEVSFDVLWETTNVSDGWVQQIIDVTNADTPMAMAFFDYAFNDSSAAGGEIAQGLIGNFYMNYQKAEAIRDVQRASVTAVNQRELIWAKISIT